LEFTGHKGAVGIETLVYNAEGRPYREAMNVILLDMIIQRQLIIFAIPMEFASTHAIGDGEENGNSASSGFAIRKKVGILMENIQGTLGRGDLPGETIESQCGKNSSLGIIRRNQVYHRAIFASNLRIFPDFDREHPQTSSNRCYVYGRTLEA
jgi:hypothetical protein